MDGKTCSKCAEWKSFGEFDKKKINKDGLTARCKKCVAEYWQKHKEKIGNVRNDYYHANKDEILKKQKEYKQINQEEIAKRNKEYNRKNKDKISDYWHTERGRALRYGYSLKRRSHKHKISFQRHDRKQLLDRDNWTCQCCRVKVHDEFTGAWNTPTKAHIDHIIPISKGGNSEPRNLRVLCRTCNLTKSDKIDEQLQLSI